ncbi:hypothetical protein [Apibacter sp. HY039]|uniref:hypothetical protein n=1 Tax=Apibacter sp. HY039 TaxID=2501476 RepID=UPI000FEC16E1|nr:hypothetical protein [Apibacter sp. HY039]
MLQDKLTQLWVRCTGKKIDPDKHSWIIGPLGEENVISDQYLKRMAEQDQLKVIVNEKNSGLLDDWDRFDLSLDEKKKLNLKVKKFYENTSEYDFEVWSEWKGVFKPLGYLLTVIFSKRLQQLNIPVSSLVMSKGLKSEIIKLKKGEHTVWTIWYRKIKSTGDVIYSGIYTTTWMPHFQRNLLKVVFPLPNGNASVIMTKKILEDGSLLLSSDGKKFGENGFYFYVTDNKGNHWAKFVKALHEWIRVYVDEEDILRTDHNFKFFGINFLNLHYKIYKKNTHKTV